MKKTKTVFRSSKTGKLVKEEFADTHPATTEKQVVKLIGELNVDFAREDLNQLRDKLNEVIRSL